MTIMVIMNDHDIGKWRAMGNVVQSQKEGAGKEVKTGQPPLKVKACLFITDHIAHSSSSSIPLPSLPSSSS